MCRIDWDIVVTVFDSELTVVNSDDTHFCGCATTTQAEDGVMDLAWVITIGVVPSQDDDPLLKQELDE